MRYARAPHPFRFLSVALLAFALAACVPGEPDVAGTDKALLVFATSIRGNYEESLLDPAPESLFRIRMSISRLVAPGREEELGSLALAHSTLREEPADTAPAVRWHAYAVEPGTYFLRSITETKDYERYEGPREKTTAFIDRATPGPLDVEALAGSDLTPVFRTYPGEAVYIGTFVVNLYTTDYGLGSRYVNNTRKVYRSEPDAARWAIAEMGLVPETFAAVNIFAGKPASRRLYEREWRGRARFE